MFSRALLTRPGLLRAPLRTYATSVRKSANQQPKVRYLFYMFLVSSGVLYMAGKKVDKKAPPKKSFDSEQELLQYEESTGLKRRHKLISAEKSDQYKFYVVPFVSNDESVEKIANKLKLLDEGKLVKVIDPKQLLLQEEQDEDRKYSYLLQDLKHTGKSVPKGLVTALVKDEINQYLNTRNGTFETNFIIKNYPQTTEEAIKFENDVASVQKCLILHYDMLNEVPKLPVEDARAIANVNGYFDTVEKTKTLVSKHDTLDDKLVDFALEDL